jgi:hypothetical protein
VWYSILFFIVKSVDGRLPGFFLYFSLLQKLISSGVASYVLALGVTHAPGACFVADVEPSTMSRTR